MSITSHVLDTALGRPAVSMGVRLDALQDSGAWTTLGSSETNADGRVAFLGPSIALARGTYRLTFATGAHFAASARPVFYPLVEVVFHVEVPTEHHHIPLLLSPFGYTTYRGS